MEEPYVWLGISLLLIAAFFLICLIVELYRGRKKVEYCKACGFHVWKKCESAADKCFCIFYDAGRGE